MATILPPLIAKVGGSLYDMPDLRERLSFFLAGEQSPILLIPGGGPTADVVRQFDQTHHLQEETAHWLALRSLSLNARFLGELLQLPVSAGEARFLNRSVLDPFLSMVADENRPDHLPHLWEVTSDSIALRIAHLVRARELVLLKSIAREGQGSWHDAVRAGLVDAFFPKALATMPMPVRIVNLRA